MVGPTELWTYAE